MERLFRVYRLVPCPATGEETHEVFEDPEGGNRCINCNIVQKFCAKFRMVEP